MNINEKDRSDDSTNVSLFPYPPWQLVNKHQNPADPPVRPPTPPGVNAYRIFGNIYNEDDAILRPLESQGVRRVYPQVYNRKRELKKINFSILANYLDLLDVITKDPSTPKRTERLDNLAVLFINMHHLANEYRQHQARDLLREILKYQVSIASQTVEKADQYLMRADEILHDAGNELTLPAQSSMPATTSSLSANCIDTVRSGLVDLGPTLAPLVQAVLDETLGDPTSRQTPSTALHIGAPFAEQGVNFEAMSSEDVNDSVLFEHLDPVLWNFLMQSQPEQSDPTSFASPD